MSTLGSASCEVCSQPASLRCSKCKGVDYCCREHQVSDWKQHKTICGSITSGTNNKFKESSTSANTFDETTIPQKTTTKQTSTKIRQCAYCYANGVGFKSCSGCHHRYFCSREHQALDWKKSHSKWCCKSGEIGFDFEIRASEGKGLGFFALRDLKKSDKIMVER